MQQSKSKFIPPQWKQLLQEDLSGLLLETVGKGQFMESEYEAVQIEGSEQSTEFYLQEQQQTIQSIKTQQFNSSMILPTDAAKPLPNIPSLTLQSVSTMGYNTTGRNTLLLINGNICKAIGNSVVYNSQIYRQHTYQILTMLYNNKHNTLLTGSIGTCPQIIQWQVQNNQLIMINKLYQPRRSLAVAYVAMITHQQKITRIVAIDKCTLHKDSCMYSYDMVTGKRIIAPFKLGKVFHMLQILQDTLLIANETSLHFIQCTTQPTIVNTIALQNVTTFCQTTTSTLLVGLRNGTILHLNNNQTTISTTMHQGWIIGIWNTNTTNTTNNTIQQFVSSGGLDHTIVLFGLDRVNHKFIKLQNIQLESYCKQFSYYDGMCIIGLRNGTHKVYCVNDDSLTITSQSSFNQLQLNEAIFKCSVVYNKFTKTFYVSSNASSSLTCLTTSSQYHIHSRPSILDICCNFIAYISQQLPQVSLSRSFMGSSILHNHTTTTTTTATVCQQLVIEDYIAKQLKHRIQIADIIDNKIGRVTTLVYSSNGVYLALGCNNGKLIILQCKSCKTICISSQQDYLTTPILNLVWSNNSHFLKASSLSQQFYFELSSTNNQHYLSKCKPKQVKQIIWQTCGRFGWQTRQIWSEMSSVDQIISIHANHKLIFVCLNNGILRVYNLPAHRQSYKQYKLFSGPFDLCINTESNGNQHTIVAYCRNRFIQLEMISE